MGPSFTVLTLQPLSAFVPIGPDRDNSATNSDLLNSRPIRTEIVFFLKCVYKAFVSETMLYVAWIF